MIQLWLRLYLISVGWRESFKQIILYNTVYISIPVFLLPVTVSCSISEPPLTIKKKSYQTYETYLINFYYEIYSGEECKQFFFFFLKFNRNAWKYNHQCETFLNTDVTIARAETDENQDSVLKQLFIDRLCLSKGLPVQLVSMILSEET